MKRVGRMLVRIVSRISPVWELKKSDMVCYSANSDFLG